MSAKAAPTLQSALSKPVVMVTSVKEVPPSLRNMRFAPLFVR